MFPDSPSTVILVAFGPFTFNPATGELSRDGRPMPLRPKPTKVLGALIAAKGRLVTREALVGAAWPDTILEEEQALHTAIRQIRRVLDDSASESMYIETVHRRGYRFRAPIKPVTAVARRQLPRWLSLAASVAIVIAAASTVLGRSSGAGEIPELGEAEYLVARGSDADVNRAVAMLEPVAASDPSSRALSILAAAYARLHRLDDAEHMAARALRDDDRSAEAHRVLAEVTMLRDHDWDAAERRFLHVLRLDPTSAPAHGGYAFLLALTGRPEESVREIRRALTLDPLSTLINGDAVILFYWAGLYEEAEVQALRTLEIEPDYWPALEYLRLSRQALGNFEGARDVAIRLLEASGAGEEVVAAAAAGRPDDGLRRYRAWLTAGTRDRLSSARPNTWVWYGLALAEEGLLDESAGALAQARQLGATMWPIGRIDPRTQGLLETQEVPAP